MLKFVPDAGSLVAATQQQSQCAYASLPTTNSFGAAMQKPEQSPNIYGMQDAHVWQKDHNA